MVLSNINREVVRLNYFELEKVGSSGISVFCPECGDGVITLKRDPDTMTILPFDMCILCGQQVEWVDIQKIRESFG